MPGDIVIILILLRQLDGHEIMNIFSFSHLGDTFYQLVYYASEI